MPRASLLAVLVALACGRAAARDPAPLVAEAGRAYDAKDYPRCAELYEQALAAGPRRPADVAYNGACCAALAGDPDRAFRLLHDAVERGYRDVKWLREDSDLTALRADPRWQTVVDGAGAAERAFLARIDVELYRMYQEDQGDRAGDTAAIDWAVVGPRDEARLRRVKEMIAAGRLRAAEDHFHAAMILQHGPQPADYQQAHELAKRAAELDPGHETARWLAAAAQDRYLHNTDKPQIWGTQYRQQDGVWTMDPIDETAVTDDERRKWNVPPLAESRRRLEEMNRRQ